VKLHNKLAIALLLGIALGAALHPYADNPALVAFNMHVLRPIGQIFLRSIFMIVVPMVFSALVIGVYQLGRGHNLSGVAGRTLAFTVVLSAASVEGCSSAAPQVLPPAYRPSKRMRRPRSR
jgi:DAACS family dicarboxylate/amino acid:cation (Na+ or H+) symporter